MIHWKTRKTGKKQADGQDAVRIVGFTRPHTCPGLDAGCTEPFLAASKAAANGVDVENMRAVHV